jgi:tRNA(Arg) A34 adenosine deaminase TadA
MCLAAIYWAKLKSLTYGATRKDAAEIGFDDDHIYREVCLPTTERAISSMQCCRREALEIMRIWPTFEDKKPY